MYISYIQAKKYVKSIINKKNSRLKNDNKNYFSDFTFSFFEKDEKIDFDFKSIEKELF